MNTREPNAAPHRPSELLDTLKRLGFGVAVAVPDGWLGEILVRIEQDATIRLVRATHEEEALAIACGVAAWRRTHRDVCSECRAAQHGRRHGHAGATLSVSAVDAGLLSGHCGGSGVLSRAQGPCDRTGSARFRVSPHAVVDRNRPIGPQVETAATYAEEASSPFALLLSREDVQW